MAVDTTNSRNGLKWIRMILLCILFGSICAFLLCPSCLSEPVIMVQTITTSVIVWLIMWQGNSMVSCLIDRYISWLENPVRRMVVGVVGHVLYTMLASVAIVWCIEAFFDVRIVKVGVTIAISVSIALFVSLVMHSRQFLLSWRVLAIESEKMKKEAVISKYETLKNQVNPHFLFNSLNALTNLIYEDQDLAAKFVHKLSEVYRYVLESRDKELVPLGTELDFVNSYIFLQKIRYEENLRVKILAEPATQGNLVPLSLQMLAENAIKHNEISEENPLYITIFTEDNYVVLKSSLQKKNILAEGSQKVGLANIQARFSFLTDRPVLILREEHEFIVKLPLVHSETLNE